MVTTVPPKRTPAQGDYASGDVRIPTGLRQEEEEIYENTFKLLEQRKKDGISPPNIVVISDIQKDVDDLVAWIMLAEMHRLGLVVLKGFVTNYTQPELRAQAGRGALNCLGLKSVPVAQGTRGTDDPKHINRVIKPYEFDQCTFMAKNEQFKSGDRLLTEIYEQAKKDGEKITLLLISSLRDAGEFVKNHRTLFNDVTKRIITQGGFSLTNNGTAYASPDAANNVFDMPNAGVLYQAAIDEKIPLRTFTKISTFATNIPDQFCIDLDNTGHELGKYLRHAQVAMDVAFYADAAGPVKNRFQPFMDTTWYLKMKSTWFDTPHAEDEPYPVGDAVVKYLSKLTAYDGLAAVGAVGDDFLDVNKIYAPNVHRSFHQVDCNIPATTIPADKATGREVVPGTTYPPGINGVMMAQTIRALGKGALLASVQGLKKVELLDT